jgi:hypothetical protein
MSFLKKALIIIPILCLAMPALAERYAPMAGAYWHTLYIADGYVFGMGLSRNGEIGGDAPPMTESYYGMAPVYTGISNAISVHAQTNRTVAVLNDGGVVWMGVPKSGTGQEAFSIPVVVPGVANAVDAAVTDHYLYIVTSSGAVYSYDFDLNSSAQMFFNGAFIYEIAAGSNHVLAMDNSGKVWSWGTSNSFGQLGNGTTAASNTPALVDLAGGFARSVRAGSLQSAAVLADGTAMAWGYNDYGQLGTGNTLQQNSPAPVLKLANIKQMDIGNSGTVVLLRDGTVYCIGWCNYTGNGMHDVTLAPVQVTELSGVTHIVNGPRDTIMTMDAYGALRGWGENLYGKLGDGTNYERHVPTLALPPPYLPPGFPTVPSIDLVAQEDVFVITGQYFNMFVPGESRVELNGVPMALVTWSDTEIKVELPMESVTGEIVVINLEGVSSEPYPITYIAPEPDQEPVDTADCRPGYSFFDQNSKCNSGPPGLLKIDPEKAAAFEAQKQAEFEEKLQKLLEAEAKVNSKGKK